MMSDAYVHGYVGVRAAGPLSVLQRQVVMHGKVDYENAFFDVKKFFLWTGVSYLTYMRAEVCKSIMCEAALAGEIDVVDEDAKGFVDVAKGLAEAARLENPHCLPGSSGLSNNTSFLLYHHDPARQRRAASMMQQLVDIKKRMPLADRPANLTAAWDVASNGRPRPWEREALHWPYSAGFMTNATARVMQRVQLLLSRHGLSMSIRGRSSSNEARIAKLSEEQVQEIAMALGQYVGTTRATLERVMCYDSNEAMLAAMRTSDGSWAPEYLPSKTNNGMEMCELTERQFLETKQIPSFFNFSTPHHGRRSSLGRRRQAAVVAVADDGVVVPPSRDGVQAAIGVAPVSELRYGHIVDTHGLNTAAIQYLELHYGAKIAARVVPAMREFMLKHREVGFGNCGEEDHNGWRWQVTIIM